MEGSLKAASRCLMFIYFLLPHWVPATWRRRAQTSISQDIEEKILSMYAKGMTTGDIEAHIQDIYGISVSDSTVSRITDKILPIAKEWQQRPLESIYAVVFLDAIEEPLPVVSLKG